MFNKLVSYIKNDVPEKFQDIFIFVSYNFIYLYSKLQITFNKKTKSFGLILNKNEKYNYLKNKITYIYETLHNKIYKKHDDNIISETNDELVSECSDEISNEHDKKLL